MSLLLKIIVALIVVPLVIIAVAICTGGLGGSGGSSGHGSYTVGGTVAGLAGTVVLKNNGEQLSISKNGSFKFSKSVNSGASYLVTVVNQPQGQYCTVANGSGAARSNVTNVTVTCVRTYPVSGTVSGLQGTGLVLQNNGRDPVQVTMNGPFLFQAPIPDGGAYVVSVAVPPSGPRQVCAITNGSGTIAGASVANVAVACTSRISGVAAAGFPLVGTVTVKDALGTSRTVDIGANGSYDVDVSDMLGPFVFRADGTANGFHYTIHSAGVAADIGGNINITPLTDLVVANVAGQIAQKYFDDCKPEGCGIAGSLTPEALSGEIQQLRQRLQSVLAALGVEASLDLLRSPFTPLASALDAALDVLRVSIDPATNIATIRNIATQQQIADSIVVPWSVEGDPEPLPAGDVNAFLADSAALRSAFDFLESLFANGLPSPASMEQFVSADYLDNDEDRASQVLDLAGNTEFIGDHFAIEIIDIDYSDPQFPKAIVKGRNFNADGTLNGEFNDARFRREDGVWRLFGNQQILDIDGHIHNVRSVNNGCRASGFEFNIWDENPGNSAQISYLIVTGPGLPGGGNVGLRYNRPATGGPWQLVPPLPGLNPNWHPLNDTCGNSWGSINRTDAFVAAIPDNARYIVRAYTAAGVEVPLRPSGGVFELVMPRRPLTLVELVAATQFPVFTASVNLFTFAGGPITIFGGNANPDEEAWVYVALTEGNGFFFQSVDTDVDVAADGTFSASFVLGTPATVGSREVRVSTEDAYERSFMTTGAF